MDRFRLYTRCSPSNVYTIVNNLDEERKDLVRQMGFGSLLGLQKCYVRRDLIMWLIERFDPVDGVLKLNGVEYKLGSNLFGKMLGVMDGGEHLPEPKEEGKNSVSRNRLSLSALKIRLENNSAPDVFVRDFVMYVLGTLLMPTTSVNVVKSVEDSMRNVNDVRKVRNKNWASISWRYLVQSVDRFQKSQSHFICGCIYFFQLYYLHEIKGYERYIDKDICPLNWWSESELKVVMRWIAGCGGYDQVNFKETRKNKVGESKDHEEKIENDSLSKTVSSEVVDMRTKLNYLESNIANKVDNKISEALTKLKCEMLSTVRCCLDKGVHSKDGIENGLSTQNVATDFDCVDGSNTSNASLEHQFSSFVMENAVDISTLSIIQHIFNLSLDTREILFSHGTYEVARFYFTGLKPGCKLDYQLVGAYALKLFCESCVHQVFAGPRCLVILPLLKKEDMFNHKKIETPLRFPAQLQTLEKVIVPILDMDEGHWYMVEVDLIKKKCFFWDSLNIMQLKNIGSKFLYNMLVAINQQSEGIILNSKSLFDNEAIPGFKLDFVDGLPQQDNATDCGVFTIMYMNACVHGHPSCHVVNIDEQRIKIAEELITNIFNERRSVVLEDSQTNFLNSFMGTSKFENSKERTLLKKWKSLSVVKNPATVPVNPLYSTQKMRNNVWTRKRKNVHNRTTLI